MRLWHVVLGAVIAGDLLTGAAARADIYRYTDGEGVVHFTNRRPGGSNRRRWRKVLDEKPTAGKPLAKRGECSGCDPVPARDRSPSRYKNYDAHIDEASQLYQIPVALIRAVIKTESDYDPRVVSSAGAQGLMQMLPKVSREMGVSDPHEPRQNILGGTRLLRVLANRYQGDLVRTIAAYHAGIGSLAKYGDNVPPYRKTRRYLKTVLDRYYRYRSQATP